MKKKNLLKQWVNQRMLFKKLFVHSLVAIGFSNKHIQSLEIRNKVFRRINKKYSKVLDNLPYREDNQTPPKKIWFAWMQGIENAPEVVKTCLETIKEHNKDCEVILITKENFKDYTTIPEYILEKYEKGIITHTHFSDILRTNLLYENGGVWIDSTVYMTGPLPKHIFERPLFLLSSVCRGDELVRLFNSWFLAAQKGSFFMEAILKLIYAYWKKENHLREYFLWHLFATIVGYKYPQAVEKIYRFSDANAEILRDVYFRPFDKEYWERLKEITPIHKLTYKLDEIPENVEGTFYDYVVNKKGQ